MIYKWNIFDLLADNISFPSVESGSFPAIERCLMNEQIFVVADGPPRSPHPFKMAVPILEPFITYQWVVREDAVSRGVESRLGLASGTIGTAPPLADSSCALCFDLRLCAETWRILGASFAVVDCHYRTPVGSNR